MAALGVLGTGQVGQAIARRAAEVGYDVTVGARTANSAGLDAFRDDPAIATGTFADAVGSAPLVVNATNGLYSLDALTQVGAEALAGKTVVDVANELRAVEHGFPVPVATAQDSLGARLQRAFPKTAVVKTLNTMNNAVMVRPATIPGDHLVFLSGDSAVAKDATRALLRAFGWRDPQFMDLGGIETAAATEMMMAIWMQVTLARGAGAPRFNWSILESTAT
jgi:8-hydroxy-5-deazaflavin:NADPH oxidoreductase